MTGMASPCPLAEQFLQLLPAVQLVKWECQDWHSATFSGQRLMMTLAHHDLQRAQVFARSLSDAEFSLQDQFVADVLVREFVESERGVDLTVEALLLDQ
jgi:hypothetical protein